MSNVFKRFASSVLLTSMCVMVPVTGYGQVPGQGITAIIDNSVINEDDLTASDVEPDVCAPMGFTKDMDEAGYASGEEQMRVERYNAQERNY